LREEWFEANPSKKFMTAHFNQESCHPRHMGSVNRRMVIQTGLGMNTGLYPKFRKAKELGAWVKL
jgi:hypothetical protein